MLTSRLALIVAFAQSPLDEPRVFDFIWVGYWIVGFCCYSLWKHAQSPGPRILYAVVFPGHCLLMIYVCFFWKLVLSILAGIRDFCNWLLERPQK